MSNKKWERLVEQFVYENAHNSRKQWDHKTINWYFARLRWLLRFVGSEKLKPKKVNPCHLHKFFCKLEQHELKYTTRKGTFTAVKHFFTWLHRTDKIKVDPFAADPSLHPPKRIKTVQPVLPLSYAEKMILAAESKTSVIAVRDSAIMRLLLTTGMRREEVTTLKIEYFNFEMCEFLIKGKFSNERRGFLRNTTLQAVQRWLQVRPRTFDRALFVGLKASVRGIYQELRPNAINDILIKWRDTAGLPRVSVSPHQWRRLFASQVAKGNNPFALQELLGHEDIATSADYVRSSVETQRSLLLTYGPDVPLEVSNEKLPEEKVA